MAVCLYVVHSGQPLPIPAGTVLSPMFSPKQNYSELWAQHTVWQRHLPEADWIGFFHQRRYLDFSMDALAQKDLQSKPLPYRIKRTPDFSWYTGEKVLSKLAGFDLIAPLPENTGVPVLERYGQSKAQRYKDLALAAEILCASQPQYCQAAQLYLSGTWEFYGNLYIMRSAVMNEYFLWLFPLLQAFEEQARDAPPRTPGYLAERLFGIWITKAMIEYKWRCGFLPRAHFSCYDDGTHHFRRDACVNLLLPPGSRRRIFLRKCLKRRAACV